MSTKTSIILSYPVAQLTMSEALHKIDELISKRCGHIITANAEILYAARHDPKLDTIVRAAELVTADGMGVVLAGRILGQPLPERVSGYDLLHGLAKVSVHKGYRLYLLGAAPGVAEEAAIKLQNLYPGLKIVGTQHGFFKKEDSAHIVYNIKESRSDFLFVAMGPRGEAWIYDHKHELGCPAMQVGGSLDIIVGKATRAPRWMQQAGLEWAYRLYKEPYRYKRMLNLPKFMLAVLAERLSKPRNH